MEARVTRAISAAKDKRQPRPDGNVSECSVAQHAILERFVACTGNISA
jgi:hypothetical protein